MNPANHSAAPSPPPRAAGMNLDDMLFTLFRHKTLILAFVGLGLIGVLAVRLVRPPLYVSKAKLMVHYVLDSRGASAANPAEAQNVRPVDFNAETVIRSQIDILTSLDVAKQVVAKIGAEKILAKKGGGNDPLAAAGVICSGIDVDPPRGAILTVSFKHPDPAIVQPVLNAIIHTFMLKHLEVYQGVGELEDYYIKQKDELRQRLATLEEELKQRKTAANVLFMDDTKHAYETQIAKAQDELMDAQRELAERQAVLGNLGAELQARSATNAAAGSVSPELLSDYGDINNELQRLKKDERELLRQYKEAYPVVQTVHSQIQKLADKKAEMERRCPALTQVAVGEGRGSTNFPGGDVTTQLTEIKRLKARVAALEGILANVKAEAARVLDVEPQIAELERQHSEAQKSYDQIIASLEQTRKGQSMAAGNVINMSVVENPTPPNLDYKKFFKLAGVALAGCIGMGLGLAFLIELVLDRSIKRTVDVEKHLRLPVFLTIPDAGWTDGTALRWLPWRRGKAARAAAVGAGNGNGSSSGPTAVAPWDPSHHLQAHADGLRERLMTYFEVRDMNLKKPKLVALTGCNEGAGVSTLASSLAASLSKTGDGNVLLVDMNGDHGMAHSFHRGKPGCGLAAALEPENRADALVQDNLYLASVQNNGSDNNLALVLPRRFNTLVPKLKASDYDYIIFDMPPAAPTSATPRLASHMDIVLLVLESEKTSQHAAARAGALMRESRVNVAAVLNKYRSHVPAPLSPDA